MNNFEFLSYDPITGEKFLGIATVRCWNKIILRYKIVPNKDGTGFFPSPSSIKNGDRYESAFMLDSNFENQQLMKIIKEKVTDYLSSPMPTGGKSTMPSDDECPF